MKIVINGAGAAGKAILKMLIHVGEKYNKYQVADILVCDSKGIIETTRGDITRNKNKNEIAFFTNKKALKGFLQDALKDADVFIGVSLGNLLSIEMVRSMAKNSIVFALANPTPEIFPEDAKKGGASVVATGRSDYPNQVNNVLVFPGIFRGALDARATRITDDMKIASIFALANYVKKPSAEFIVPSPLDKGVARVVAEATRQSCKNL